MKYLFVNGSPEKDGNTAKLAKILLNGKACETLELADYKIYGYGQHFSDDQFDEVVDRMKDAGALVIGSPVYWHNMSGLVRNLLDRFYGAVDEGVFENKPLYFLYQGAAPQDWMIRDGEYTMKRFAHLYGLDYKGMATSPAEAQTLSAKL